MEHFAAVYKDDLLKNEGIIYFNLTKVNPNFAAFSVKMKVGGNTKAEKALLKEVQKEYPKAKLADRERSVYVEIPVEEAAPAKPKAVKKYPGTIIQLAAEMQKLVQLPLIRKSTIPAVLQEAFKDFIVGRTMEGGPGEEPLVFRRDLQEFWQQCLQKGLGEVVQFEK